MVKDTQQYRENLDKDIEIQINQIRTVIRNVFNSDIHIWIEKRSGILLCLQELLKTKKLPERELKDLERDIEVALSDLDYEISNVKGLQILDSDLRKIWTEIKYRLGRINERT